MRDGHAGKASARGELFFCSGIFNRALAVRIAVVNAARMAVRW